jgi:hypothetical protein
LYLSSQEWSNGEDSRLWEVRLYLVEKLHQEIRVLPLTVLVCMTRESP